MPQRLLALKRPARRNAPHESAWSAPPAATRLRDTPFIRSGLSLPSALAIRKDMRRWRGGNGSSPGNQRRTAMETSRRTFLTTAAVMAATAATAPLSSAADKFARDRDWTGETPITYPEPAWEVKDQRFTGMQGNATLQRIWHGMGNDRALGAKARCGWETGAASSGATSRTIARCAGSRTTAT